MFLIILNDYPFVNVRVDDYPDNTSHAEVSGAVMYSLGGSGWIDMDITGENAFSITHDGGLTWGAHFGDPGPACCDPVVRIWGNTVHLVWLGNYYTYYMRSTDGGLTWSSAINAGNCSSTDHPWIAVRNDTAVIIYSNYCTSSTIYSAYSYNNGATWSRAAVYSTGGVPMAASDDSLFYAVWWRSSGSCRSTNGATWSSPTNAACMTPDIAPNPYPAGYQPVGWGKGNIGIIYMAGSLSNLKVEFVKSTNGGATWSSPVRITSNPPSVAEYMPALAADPYGGLHAFWYDNSAGTGLWGLYYSYSTDGGNSWSSPIRVSDTYFPFVDRSGCGGVSGVDYTNDCWPGHYIDAWADGNNVYVVWSDNRIVSGGRNYWHIWFAYAPIPYLKVSENLSVKGEEAEVYNVEGRLVGKDISNLPKGVYMVKRGNRVYKVIRR
ncbi:MAG: hypothetical protein ABIL50_06870 [candidate division WOR-3 bacterium]